MRTQDRAEHPAQYSIASPAAHSIHESSGIADFCERFADFTGRTVQQLTDEIVDPEAPKAVFLSGSIPLGMGTHGSDVDLVVLVDSEAAFSARTATAGTNSRHKLSFSNESDPLRVALCLDVINGLTVEVAVVLAPAIARVNRRLRAKGPELSEIDIMTLGRIGTGWLLFQSGEFLLSRGLKLPDPALDVYCSTRQFSYSLIYRLKAGRALELHDIAQALHLGRLSVEAAYLAYFASEGMSYLGAKWLAQLGHARGACQRLQRHPLLAEGTALLFPSYGDVTRAYHYLQAAGEFVRNMKSLIEQRMLFKIAFRACPQIYPI